MSRHVKDATSESSWIRMAWAGLVVWIVVGTTGCARGPVEPDAEPASDDGQMATAIVLDAHAHFASCALWQSRDATSECTGEVVPTEECNPDSDNLITTAADDAATYSDVSGSQLTQVFSMAYGWSAPSKLGSDDYEASDLEVANVQCENDYVVNQAKAAAGALLPFCSVDPKRDYAITEIDRCIDELGVAGLKMHFSSSEVDVTDAQTAQWVLDVLAHAASRDLPVVIHFADLEVLCGTCDGQDPDDQNKQGMVDAMNVMLDEILPGAPGLHLTFAHLTGVGSFPDWTQQTFEQLIDAYQPGGLLRELGLDIYVDLAAVFDQEPSVCNGSVCQIPGVTSDDLAVMGDLLEQWGYDRVLWGSDLDPSGFDATVSLWPGTVDDFNQVAAANGKGFRSY